MDSTDLMGCYTAYTTPNTVLQEMAAAGIAAEVISLPFSVSLPGPPSVSVVSYSFSVAQ